MKEIICPNCHTPFQVDDNYYAAIVEQVRNSVFKEELERRTSEIEKQYESNLKANAISAEKAETERMAEKDSTIAELKQTIERLNGILAGYASEKKAEMAELKADQREALARLSAEKDKEIASLEVKIANSDKQHELDLQKERNINKDELHAKEQAITRLTSQLEEAQTASKNRELELKENHSILLKEKQAEIDRLKDYKARLSVKMVGENLEQHCANTFAQAQCNGLYPHASFDKDNDISTSGTKGDFIFRDYVNGKEYISIMFEMKNENDTTVTKHKNVDFLEKLDRDRRNKKCEYAVLVTMLEQDNPLYEQGIVDMSHKYQKMIIIRPQFLMPLLRVLTEAEKRNLDQVHSLQDELAIAKEQSLDVTKLWDRILKTKTSFDKNVTAARAKFESAVSGIDKVIAALEKQIADLRNVKTYFDASEQKLLKANEVLEEDFTIKKLTHGNPSMRSKLEKADQDLSSKNLLNNQ